MSIIADRVKIRVKEVLAMLEAEQRMEQACVNTLKGLDCYPEEGRIRQHQLAADRLESAVAHMRSVLQDVS